MIWSGDDCTGTGHRTVYAAPADGDGTSPGDALFPEDVTDAVPGYTLAKYDPIYSPDGEQIAFVSWQDGFDHLAVAPATGGSITNVVRCVFCSPLWLEKPPPDTSIISAPPETTSSTTATLEFTSDQSGVSFECSLDDEAFEDCDSPASYSGLAEGPHAFEVRAVGVAGTDATPARRGFTVDLSIPPHVSDTNPENGKTRVPRAVKPRATFDTELDASTVTTDSVKMRVYNARKERWVSVPSSPSYASRVVTVTPENTLGSKKWYQVIFATGITSATGKNLEGAFRFSFTTRG